MKKMMIAALVLFAANANAGLEPGTYKGTKDGVNDCFLTVHGSDYSRGFGHKSPYNERVEITTEEINFTLKHPAEFDFNAMDMKVDTTRLNDVFTYGENRYTAVEVKMSHTSEFEGPTDQKSVNL